ncbi:MAG: LptA/OstA family protein, partial [Terriglobales bacterium]
ALPGRLSTLSAQSLDFGFSPAHELRTLLASGAARLQLGGPRPQSLAAPSLAFDFAARLARVPRLAAVRSLGRATVQLAPTGQGSGPVVARADIVRLQLDADQHPQRGLATGHVELTQLAGSEVRSSQCDRLDLLFTPVTVSREGGAALREAIETGQVQLRQGERVVSGDRLVYHPADGSAEITAAPSSGFSHGFVRGEDPLTRFQARSLTWTSQLRRGGLLRARGDVSLSRAAAPTGASAPAGFGSNLPFVVTANALDWSQPPTPPAARVNSFGAASFRGAVRLLQSPNLLTADQLDLDQAAGTLLARGHVRTNFAAPPGTSAAAPGLAHRTARPTAVEIQSDSLLFQQAAGVATYRGGVAMHTGDAHLTAPELQVWLTQGAHGAGRLERALAQGGVNLAQPGRTASSRQLRYDFAAGRVELLGGPPSIFDAEHGQIHGDPLTFFLANDEIQVGSPQGARAEGQTVVH